MKVIFQKLKAYFRVTKDENERGKWKKQTQKKKIEMGTIERKKNESKKNSIKLQKDKKEKVTE